MTKKAKRLTPKQKAFVNKYVECGNASEAYRHAYDAEKSSPGTIKVSASRLLSNPNIALTIDVLQERARERTLVTVESQTERLKSLSQKAEGFDNAPGVSAAVNAEKEINKLNGLITDKTEHSGEVKVQTLPWEHMYGGGDSQPDT